jgi:preprotein translocase subunit SecY
MSAFFLKIKTVLSDAIMRRRIFFTIGGLVLFRLLSAIPVPTIDAIRLERLASNQLFSLIDIFSGGGISRVSMVMLGVGPYITGSIIMQLFTMIFPKMKEMYQEEGEIGRTRFAQYSRLLSIPLGLIQSYAFLTLLQSQNIIPHVGAFDFAVNIIVVTAGSVLLMWLGELISEFGIGNGVSLIIFAGIVAALPTRIAQFVQTFDPGQLPYYLMFLVGAAVIVALVVAVTEAERPVPVTYAKQVRGNAVTGGVSTYIPLRLNQAGVIPIIFAVSILILPQIVYNFVQQTAYVNVSEFLGTVVGYINDPWIHSALYFIFVFLFTYFYTAVTFDPVQVAENLQKSGAFVPGVRPGEGTSTYLGNVVSRITFGGAIFLGLVAVLPVIMQGVTGSQALGIGGTALLIVVSVVLDLVKRVDAQASMREY